MDDPEMERFARERSPRVTEPIRCPKKRRNSLVASVTLGSLACLIAMCRVPNWDGAGSSGLTAQEQRDALASPIPSEEKRRAAVLTAQDDALRSIALLQGVAAEDGDAAGDARVALGNLRAALGD